MKKVAILGGGVAGLSAAHELAERGFDVTVYERKGIPGGKARSVPVPNSGTGGRKDLPGEHGFRFFPRFYRHLKDTLKRIPYGRNRNGVLDNLVQLSRMELRQMGLPPIVLSARFPRNLSDIEVIFREIFTDPMGLSDDDYRFFAARMWQIISSCTDRRQDEYEKLGWWEYVEAAQRSPAYQKFLGIGLTRTLVAAKAEKASTKTIGDIGVQMMFDLALPGVSTDCVLNGPTNEAWIDPWMQYLRGLGVRYYTDATVRTIQCDGRVITGVEVERGGERQTVQADYYLAAVPVEVMASLLWMNPTLIQADPTLAGIQQLSQYVEWMNGIQFYLRKDVPVVNGHMNFIDSPWAITAVSQQQFWQGYPLSEYGDGQVGGILSVDISNWEAVGLNGKIAKDCTSEEVAKEAWEELKASLNVKGDVLLRDEDLHSYFLDPDIICFRSKAPGEPPKPDSNHEPLLVNLINTWKLRPNAHTLVPNLFLASDYIRTYTDLATMEGANEAARRAANCILDAAGGRDYCPVWPMQEPEIFDPWKRHDQERYDRGLPWDGNLGLFGR